MEPRKLTPEHLETFAAHLRQQEKSAATVEKYRRDAAVFFAFAGDAPVDAALTAAYKAHLLARGYADRSVNSMLASLNSLLAFLGWEDCKVKSVRLQRAAYCPADRELTRSEYLRLLSAAEGKPRLRLVMETICATGIRVSELRHFTVEAIRRGEVTIRCKGKSRRVLLPGKLRRRLLDYAACSHLQSGPLFLTRGGKPLDRTAIWDQMKALCRRAGVAAEKVFPHNLRHLFARSFYALEKDIAKLADVLGHSSIDTTRIYLMTSGTEHRRQLDRLHLVL